MSTASEGRVRIRSANRWVIGSTHHGAVSTRPSATVNSPPWKRLSGEPAARSEITGLESSFASSAGRWRRSSLRRENMALLLARCLPAGGPLPVAGCTASEDVALLLRAAILPLILLMRMTYLMMPLVTRLLRGWVYLAEGIASGAMATARATGKARSRDSNLGSLGQGPDKHSVAANLEPTRRSIIPVQ